jgi:hypothetical protein
VRLPACSAFAWNFFPQSQTTINDMIPSSAFQYSKQPLTISRLQVVFMVGSVALVVSPSMFRLLESNSSFAIGLKPLQAGSTIPF